MIYIYYKTMDLDLKAPDIPNLTPTIAVFGVGGAGGNAVANMINAKLQGAHFIVANTDAQALQHSNCNTKLQLGKSVEGLGAGADPEIGKKAAEESEDEIRSLLEGSNMVFVTAGMGGGTGTGASPVIAKIAKELGILTVGVVTKPFMFEGQRRMRTAEQGLKELQEHVDTLIIIPNQNIFRVANENTTFVEAFKMADEVLHDGVRGITDLITMPGLVNLDFADIKSVMSEQGKATMGTGEGQGEDKEIKAVEAAIANPLLDHNSMHGASAVLVNITGGKDMTLFQLDTAINRIRKEVGDSDANIIFGSAFNSDLEGVIRVSVVATGIDAKNNNQTQQHLSHNDENHYQKPYPNSNSHDEFIRDKNDQDIEDLIHEGDMKKENNDGNNASSERLQNKASVQHDKTKKQLVNKNVKPSIAKRMWSMFFSVEQLDRKDHSVNDLENISADEETEQNSNNVHSINDAPSLRKR